MMRLPPLKALRAFEAAARHMSFKAAADELGLTPTAISHQIRLLETSVGGSLFHRRPRPLTLTSAGAALFPAVQSGFDLMAEAFAIVRSERVSPLQVSTTAGISLDPPSIPNPEQVGSTAVQRSSSSPRLSLAVLPFCKYRRRSRPGIFCRWHYREPHHRPVAHFGRFCHRSQYRLRL